MRTDGAKWRGLMLCVLTACLAVYDVNVACSQDASKSSDGVDAAQSGAAVEALREFLTKAQSEGNRGAIVDQPFARIPLTRGHADLARQLLTEDHAQRIRLSRKKEMETKEITIGDKSMKFAVTIFGDKPKDGRSLFISMHGGGNAAARVNDQQWSNQQKLYTPTEGVYVAPRAPTNTWNLWHEEHIDAMLDRLIEDMIVFEDVNSNRVYLTGYSAGGDGVYQLAPRMADRFAAAAMMAGHPNESSPLGLRNLPFAIHVGENDSAYNRNKVAKEWDAKLAELHAADPAGYEYYAKLHAGTGTLDESRRRGSNRLDGKAYSQHSAQENRVATRRRDAQSLLLAGYPRWHCQGWNRNHCPAGGPVNHCRMS